MSHGVRQDDGTAPGSFPGQSYVWHPAADDRQLAHAYMDVRAGRYLGAFEALRDARDDFGLRAHRSLVLASEAADSDLAERWLAEEPSPEAALVWARVAVLRTLRAAVARGRHVAQLARIALTACGRAQELSTDGDPTPGAVRLALTPLQRGPRQTPPPGLMTAPAGPWALLWRVLRLDPWHREAHHQFLRFFFTRHGGAPNHAWDVAEFLSGRVPHTSPLRLLPLVVLAEEYDPARPLARYAWLRPQWRSAALSVYEHWFPEVAGYRFTPVLDLSYLAHALYMAECATEARAVFVAMGPYAARLPWSGLGAPENELTRARRACGLPVPGVSDR